MGYLLALLALIVIPTTVSLGITYFACRAVWRAGKHLLNGIRGNRELPGTTQQPTRAAQDVVVEPVAPPAPKTTVRSGQTQSSQTQSGQAQGGPVRGDYVRLDVDDGTTANDIIKVMQPYQSDPVMGGYARGILDTVNSCELRRRTLYVELDGTFQRNTMSWDKFATPIQAAVNSILDNAAHMANTIQSFDTASYLRLKSTMGTEWRKLDSNHNETRELRWKLHKQTFDTLDAMQETNESLLLELDKLAAELANITVADNNDTSDYILEEIRRLVDEAKYYR
ncbi:MAG: hypothetical protein Q4C09_02030 [Atopobiaceae bacterium]|nr:hypothetical protein [Atopobiaceae bacterium]